MVKKPKIIAILLAYNAASTLQNFYRQLPKRVFDEIILFDDASQDGTLKVAKELGITSYKNRTNLGYGGNLKKAFAISLVRGGEIIVDIHPDGEYKTDVLPSALKLATSGADLVLGNRFYDLDYVLNKSGMFLWKLIPLLALNFLCNLILGTHISDFHQGFRVYTKSLLEQINFEKNSNNYLFSFELIAQAVFVKAKIAEVPVNTKYTGKKRGADLISSINYTLGTFKVMILFLLAKVGVNIGIFC